MMLASPTRDRLRQLGLAAMVTEWDRQAQQPDMAALSFEDRLGLLADAEWTARHTRRLQRRLREARLRLPATPEDLNWQAPRHLPQSLLRTLFQGRWVVEQQTVLITGPTGVGKPYLLCALGHAACRQDRRVGYFRCPRLLGEASVAKADGTWLRWLKRLARYDVLLLDDWGLEPFTAPASQDLLEILDDRYQLKATAIASQTPVEQWHSLFPDPTVADAICDRLVHQSHRVALQGESMRKVLSPGTKPATTAPTV
jgi:DNA replication protein DnaC